MSLPLIKPLIKQNHHCFVNPYLGSTNSFKEASSSIQYARDEMASRIENIEKNSSNILDKILNKIFAIIDRILSAFENKPKMEKNYLSEKEVQEIISNAPALPNVQYKEHLKALRKALRADFIASKVMNDHLDKVVNKKEYASFKSYLVELQGKIKELSPTRNVAQIIEEEIEKY